MFSDTLLPVVINLPEDQGSVLQEGSGIGSELWWVSSRLTGAGRNFWAHWFTVHSSEPVPGFVGWTAIRDADDDRQAHATFEYSADEGSVAKGALDVQVPGSRFSGPLEEMTLTSTVDDGSIELVLRPASPVLYGAGPGFYPLYDAITYQYSLGGIPTTGTVELKGETVAVTGTTWYDRQWFKGPLPGGPLTWFGLCLDNGENLSIFDVPPNGTSWVTAVHLDGSQTHSPIAPLSESASGEVLVAESGNVHPQSWTIEIPILQAELHLTQTLLHENDYLYTGSVQVAGTYRGEPIAGFGFTDLVPVYGQ
jgi:hypothetical protein